MNILVTGASGLVGSAFVRAAARRGHRVTGFTHAHEGSLEGVAQRLRVGNRVIELQPMFDDQELETRGSTGITYWEGAVTVTEAGRTIGRGYLELTGYAQAMRI